MQRGVRHRRTLNHPKGSRCAKPHIKPNTHLPPHQLRMLRRQQSIPQVGSSRWGSSGLSASALPSACPSVSLPFHSPPSNRTLLAIAPCRRETGRAPIQTRWHPMRPRHAEAGSAEPNDFRDLLESPSLFQASRAKASVRKSFRATAPVPSPKQSVRLPRPRRSPCRAAGGDRNLTNSLPAARKFL